jgi:hypothetical protein
MEAWFTAVKPYYYMVTARSPIAAGDDGIVGVKGVVGVDAAVVAKVGAVTEAAEGACQARVTSHGDRQVLSRHRKMGQVRVRFGPNPVHQFCALNRTSSMLNPGPDFSPVRKGSAPNRGSEPDCGITITRR